MLESPADDQWERLLTKLRRGPCGIVKQGPFLASPVLSARRGSMSIANSRQLRWWALAVIPLFVLYAYLDYWQRGDLLAFATLLLSDRLSYVLYSAGVLTCGSFIRGTGR
jgi:hypothetical protein